jgi:hypothetical protein
MSQNTNNISQSEKTRILHDWINHMDEYAQDDLLIEFLGFKGEKSSAKPSVREVFIVVDLERSGDESIYDVCYTEEKAKKSAKELEEMRTYGAYTEIIKHDIN